MPPDLLDDALELDAGRSRRRACAMNSPRRALSRAHEPSGPRDWRKTASAPQIRRDQKLANLFTRLPWRRKSGHLSRARGISATAAQGWKPPPQHLVKAYCRSLNDRALKAVPSSRLALG